MILGLFNGTTIEGLKIQREKIQKLQERFAERKAQARADRLVGIAELQRELQALDELQ